MTMTKTTWKFYLDSNSAWEAIIEETQKATTSIDLEEFILHDDVVGQRILNILKEKAAAGVTVRLLLDWLGSRYTYFPQSYTELTDAGIRLTFFNPLTPWSSRHKTFSYYRDHNKNIIIDSKVAFNGGICISKDMDHWRDTTVRIEGGVVSEMLQGFEFMWAHATREQMRKGMQYTPPEQREFNFILNIPKKGKRYLYQTFLQHIDEAKKEILITNPYFAPTHKLFKLLKRKARQGVKISIVTPCNPDSIIVKHAAQSYISSALKLGIRVFYQQPPINHSKTMVIDESWATVGSMNFDHISLIHNFEGNIVTTNKDLALELKKYFIDDMAKSKELDIASWRKRHWKERLLAWLIFPLRRWL